MSSIANMDADRKLVVLKNAVLALTNQKQAVEAARAELEAKAAALAEALAKSEERNAVLTAKNKELTAEVERLNSSAGRLAALPGAAARSLLGTLAGGASSPAAAAGGGGSSTAKDGAIDQQRLFEENEALHIQLFERRTEYERRLRQLEGEKTQLAMRTHTLEGLVASAQATGVETSQQATEARRELAIERGYTSLCQYMLLRGLAGPHTDLMLAASSPSSHSQQPPSAAAEAALLMLDAMDGANAPSSAAPSSAAACMGVLDAVMRRCCEVIQQSMGAVSALLPHTVASGPSSSSSSAASASPFQLAQEAQRQRTVIAAHREHRNTINAICGGLLADLAEGSPSTDASESVASGGDLLASGGGADLPAPPITAEPSDPREAFTALEERSERVADRLVALLSHTTAWLHLLHNNAALLLGPLEASHAARSLALLAKGGRGGGSSGAEASAATAAEVRTLEQQFQSVIASIIGELRVVRDCLRGAGVLSMTYSHPHDCVDSAAANGASGVRAIPLALRLLGAMMAYRSECAAAASDSRGGKLSFERLLYNIEAAAGHGEGGHEEPSSASASASTAPAKHYVVPLRHLLTAVRSASRQWGAAFGGLALYDGVSTAEQLSVGHNHHSASGGRKAIGPAYSSTSSSSSRRPKGALTRAMAAYFAATTSAPKALGSGSGSGLAADGEAAAGENMTAALDRAAAIIHQQQQQQQSSSATLPPIEAFAALETEMAAHLRAADANATHCYAVSRRAMLELAHCHDRIDQLAARGEALEGDNDRMRREYVGVVDVYEGQIRLLSEHLAELAQDGSVPANGKKR